MNENCTNSSTPVNIGQPGAAGQQGEAGTVKGAKGETGDKGPIGNQGSQGIQGPYVLASDSVCKLSANFVLLPQIPNNTGNTQIDINNPLCYLNGMLLALQPGTYIADFGCWIYQSVSRVFAPNTDVYFKMEITDLAGNVIAPIECTYRVQTIRAAGTHQYDREIIAINSGVFTVSSICQLRVHAANSYYQPTIQVLERMLRYIKIQ